MKAAFIVPKNSIISDIKRDTYCLDDLWEFKARKRLWSTPSLSLLTIAGFLLKNSVIDYIDLNYCNEISGSYDWAFFSPSTSQAYNAYSIADNLRGRGVKVAMGGVHVSELPQEALEHSDTIFLGEAEETFPLFLEDAKNGSALSVYKASSSPDMSLSPIPRYDLAKAYPYKSIPIQTSRGCPHQCSFCISSKLYGEKIRRKTIKQISNELETILKLYIKPFIFFTDDNFFINKEYCREIVNILKNLGIRWYAFTDASIANHPKLLKELYKAGCSQLLIGFESLNQENLAEINSSKWKMKKLDSYREIISKIQSFGIGVVGSFVLGLDGDTKETFEELYEFIESTSLYATNITMITPFPGTKMYEKLKTENRIIADDWSKYNGFEMTISPQNMSIEEFEEGFEKLTQRLNSPERIVKVINYFKEVFNSNTLKSRLEDRKIR